jgi:hypothetical protein
VLYIHNNTNEREREREREKDSDLNKRLRISKVEFVSKSVEDKGQLIKIEWISVAYRNNLQNIKNKEKKTASSVCLCVCV